jgi:hypothetical protein
MTLIEIADKAVAEMTVQEAADFAKKLNVADNEVLTEEQKKKLAETIALLCFATYYKK